MWLLCVALNLVAIGYGRLSSRSLEECTVLLVHAQLFGPDEFLDFLCCIACKAI